MKLKPINWGTKITGVVLLSVVMVSIVFIIRSIDALCRSFGALFKEFFVKFSNDEKITLP